MTTTCPSGVTVGRMPLEQPPLWSRRFVLQRYVASSDIQQVDHWIFVIYHDVRNPSLTDNKTMHWNMESNGTR